MDYEFTGLKHVIYVTRACNSQKLHVHRCRYTLLIIITVLLNPEPRVADSQNHISLLQLVRSKTCVHHSRLLRIGIRSNEKKRLFRKMRRAYSHQRKDDS